MRYWPSDDCTHVQCSRLETLDQNSGVTYLQIYSHISMYLVFLFFCSIFVLVGSWWYLAVSCKLMLAECEEWTYLSSTFLIFCLCVSGYHHCPSSKWMICQKIDVLWWPLKFLFVYTRSCMYCFNSHVASHPVLASCLLQFSSVLAAYPVLYCNLIKDSPHLWFKPCFSVLCITNVFMCVWHLSLADSVCECMHVHCV